MISRQWRDEDIVPSVTPHILLVDFCEIGELDLCAPGVSCAKAGLLHEFDERSESTAGGTAELFPEYIGLSVARTVIPQSSQTTASTIFSIQASSSGIPSVRSA